MTKTTHKPQLIILMGVAGTGKTTLGRRLAERLGYIFLDADDFHSTDAVNRMRGGMPLTDAIRDAWTDRLHAALTTRFAEGTNCVLAFSGLRARNRRSLMQTGFDTRAFMLDGSKTLLTLRLTQRHGHFMPLSQLQNQLESMQPVEADEPIERIDIDASPEDIVTTLQDKAIKGK